MQYVMYFRFCGWRHIFTQWSEWARIKDDSYAILSTWPVGGTSGTSEVVWSSLTRGGTGGEVCCSPTASCSHRLDSNFITIAKIPSLAVLWSVHWKNDIKVSVTFCSLFPLTQQEAQLSPRDPRDAFSVEMLSYFRTNNANRSRVSLSSTFSNFHVATCTCIVQLSYSEHAMPWVSSTDYRTNLVDVNWTVTVIITFRYLSVQS